MPTEPNQQQHRHNMSMQSSPIKPISMRMSQGTSVKSAQKDRMFEDDINDRLDFDKSLNIQSSA